MHTVMSRLNALFAYFVSVMGAMTLLLFLSTYMNVYSNDVQIAAPQIAAPQIAVRSMMDRSKEKYTDLGLVSLNLNTNLTELFDWNVKQLFLFLTAEYRTKDNELNQVVLWDKIVERDDNYIIDLSRIPPKYYFWDDGNGLLANKNVTLTLSYNVVPNSGLLLNYVARGKSVLQFPDTYKR